MKAAFLINPLSHSVAKHGSILDKSGQGSGIQRHHLQPFDQLPGVITDLAKTGCELVFIEGGDGTIQGVLTEVLKQAAKFPTMPKFVLLSGGMTNLVAAQIGIKKPTQAKINKILQTPGQAKSVQLPLLNIAYGDNKPAYQGFLFSTGAVATATRYTVDEVHTAGINGSAAVRTTLRRALFGNRAQRDLILKPSSLDLSIDGEQIAGEHILTTVTTLTGSFVGFHPFWGKGNGPVKLIYVQGGARNKVRNVARLIKKTQPDRGFKTLKADGFRSWSVDSCTLTHAGPIVLDGEFLPQTNDPITLSASASLCFIK